MQHSTLEQTLVRRQLCPRQRVAGDTSQHLADVLLIQTDKGLAAILRVTQLVQVSWENVESVISCIAVWWDEFHFLVRFFFGEDFSL